jgi:hypothetical protein
MRLLMYCALVLVFNLVNRVSIAQSFTSSNLPIIVINTLGQTIVDEPKTLMKMGIINNGVGNINYITDPHNGYKGQIAIEIRGSSSQAFPQLSYGFETLLNDTTVKASLLGMPAEHDWILYAPYTDKTLIRNVLTYRLANEMGYYASRTRFCELVIDGSYQGVYVLMEKIKRDNIRVDISKMHADDTTGDQLTGGYIVKIDKMTGSGGDGWSSSYVSNNNTDTPFFQYDYPKYDDITPEQKDYIKNYFDNFEDTLKAAFYDDPLNGYAKFINTNSFFDFLILNEISRNVDGYRLSSYFHKDRDSLGGKINAGPVWDFNLGWWNADYCDGDNYIGWAYLFPQICSWDGYQPPFWWERLLEDEVFKNKLHCRWNYLRSNILSTARLNTLVDGYRDTLNAGAQQRHFTKWPILGNYVWPNPSPIATTFSGEMTHLKQWITNRTTWMDNNIQGDCSNQPVLLMNLSGVCIGNTVTLTWKTYSEKSVDHYDIQRKDISGVFNTIGNVSVTNLDGYREYQFDDNIAGSDHYTYRLAVVPSTGTTDYSEVIRTKKCSITTSVISEVTQTTEFISLDPNPCLSELFIYNNSPTVIAGYDLYTVTGTYIGGEKFILYKDKIEIKEVPQLNQGLYMIKIYSNNNTIVKKLIKN